MSWCRFHHSTPVDLDEKGLSLGAKWLFSCSFNWCSRAQSDGRIGKGVALRSLLAEANVPQKHVKELVEAGMWLDLGDAFEVKNFLRYQNSRDQNEAKRELQRQRQREYDERKKSRGVPDASDDASGNRRLTDKKNVNDAPREDREDREDKSKGSCSNKPPKPDASGPAPAPALPSGLRDRGFPDLWRRWLEHLEAQGKPWGKPLQTSKLAELEPLGPDVAGEAIREALAKGWVSLHPDRERPRSTLEPGESPRRFTTVAEARALLGE